MTGARPVARLLAPVIVRIALLMFVMAAIAVTGVVVATSAVNHVIDELQPAAAAHKDTLQDLSDMQAAVRVWARIGNQSAIDDYEQAADRLPGHQAQVREFAEGDPELNALLDEEEVAAEAWATDYAQERLADPGGPGTYQPLTFARGMEMFATFRNAHDEVTAAIDARGLAARDAAQRRLQGTVLAVLLTALVGAVVIARARRRLLSELADPLKDLELVVQRRAAQDREARAAEAGPREVQAIASALNDLADAQGRAHAVEVRIQDELRNLDTAMDDFVSNVSHELRTPLTTISGYLELVAEEFEDRMEPRHEKMLAASRRNVSRLRMLIDDLLTLSRAEARATELVPIDLVGIVGDVVIDVRMTAARRSIVVGVDAPDEVLCVLGDRPMLHRALLNLVSNAVKFSREGGTVEVTVSSYGDHYDVVVRDHGIGIPKSEIDRLGTRFFRASNAVANEIGGTGLGVRIVQTIIDTHHGRVVIESEEGVGTTVSVRLPSESQPDPDPTIFPSMTAS
jgi:two-component system OmpR family sensor kinase